MAGTARTVDGDPRCWAPFLFPRCLTDPLPILPPLVSDKSIRIWRYRPLWHNSFSPRLYAHLEGGVAGSALVGSFRMSLMVRAFLCLWFGICLLFGQSDWDEDRRFIERYVRTCVGDSI